MSCMILSCIKHLCLDAYIHTYHVYASNYKWAPKTLVLQSNPGHLSRQTEPMFELDTIQLDSLRSRHNYLVHNIILLL